MRAELVREAGNLVAVRFMTHKVFGERKQGVERRLMEEASAGRRQEAMQVFAEDKQEVGS